MNPARFILLALCAVSLVMGAFGLARQGAPASRANIHDELQDIPLAAQTPSGAAERPQKCASTGAESACSPRVNTDLPHDSDGTGADSRRPQQQQPFDAGNASISGQVVSDKGEPLAGVTVTALSTQYVQGNIYWTPEDADFWRKQMEEYLRRRTSQRRTGTDKQGRFVLTGLHPDHTYNLTAQLSTHVRSQRLNVTPGDFVELVLTRTPGLRGRVITQEGKAVESFTIYTQRQSEDGSGGGYTIYSFSSRPDGRFEVPALPGNLAVQAQTHDMIMREAVVVQVGESGADVELVLEPAATAVIAVTDADNTPCVSITVYMNLISDPNHDIFSLRRFGRTAGASTSNAGVARAGPLIPGRWRIMAGYGGSDTGGWAKVEVDLIPGDNVVKLQAEISRLVIIKLTDDQEKPVVVQQLSIYAPSGDEPAYDHLDNWKPGIERIAGLVPGRYRAVITCRGIIIERNIEVSDGITRLSLVVPSPAALTVRVDPVAAATKPLEEGESHDDLLHRISIRMFRDPRPTDFEWERYRMADELQSDQSFKIGALEPGEWNVEIVAPDELVIASQRVTLKPGENETRFVLAPSATLKLTVGNTIPDERTTHWLNVNLSRPGDNNRVTQMHTSPGNSKTIELTLLPPGEYRLHVAQNNMVAFAHLRLNIGENVHIVNLQPSNCLLVESVAADSPAAKAGMRPGDLIIECNGIAVIDAQTLIRARDASGPEKPVRVRVLRDGKEMSFELEAARMGVVAIPALR